MCEVLLSVIVPCYNGERFIERCITSVLNQTYKNIEIIIVNDGSTDNSKNIIDKISLNDNRIIVVHQNNQGSSRTRKIGIEKSSGNYITFVDIDDWIHPNMYEFMMNGIIKENADIAQCGVCDVFIKNEALEFKHRRYNEINGTYQKYNKLEGILRILDDKEWQSYMWNKIYKKELFKNIVFPIGRFQDEDLSIMHQIFHNANISIYFQSEFYYYLQGGVTQDKNDKNKAKNIIDRCNARWERFVFTKEHKDYYPMLNKMHNIFLSVSIAGLRYAIKYPLYFSVQDLNDIYLRIKKNPLCLRKQMKEYFSLKKRIELYLLLYFPSLYKRIIKLLF